MHKERCKDVTDEMGITIRNCYQVILNKKKIKMVPFI